jgi:hypothetical protein
VPGTKLFVSHDVGDKPLVDAFVKLLEGGIGVPPGDIFCASLKGQGVKPGRDFKESIREHLDGATCVIALITPRFYSSAYCMCELGGVWIHAKSLIPILVPPLTLSDLKAVLVGLQALMITEKADLDQLRDDVAKQLSIEPLLTPRWSVRRDEFLDSLPLILKQLPDEATVTRATHDEALKELNEYKAEFIKSEGEVKRLQAIIAGLIAIKDAPKAAAIIQEHSSRTFLRGRKLRVPRGNCFENCSSTASSRPRGPLLSSLGQRLHPKRTRRVGRGKSLSRKRATKVER